MTSPGHCRILPAIRPAVRPRLCYADRQGPANNSCIRHGRLMFTEGQLVAARFIIQSKLADGRLGPVFRALDVDSHDLVALRAITTPIAATGAIEQELREISSLRHPHIAAPGELHFTEDRQPFLAGELAEGTPLDALLREQGPLAIGRACSLGRQIATALEATHHAGLIHGDLKPSSILVAAGDEEEVIKVCGFGTYPIKKGRFISLARLALSSDGDARFGSPGYIPPEQALGTSGDALDGRSDLYALGVILYEMLTGALPCTGATAMETLLAQVFSPPKPLSSHSGQDIPLVLETLIMRSLAKRRDDRPASATVIADQLAAWTQKKAPARAEPVGTQLDVANAPMVSGAPIATEGILASAGGRDFAEEAPIPEQTGAPTEPANAQFFADLRPAVEADSRMDVQAPAQLDGGEAALDLELPETATKEVQAGINAGAEEHARAQLTGSESFELELPSEAGGAAGPAETAGSQRTESELETAPVLEQAETADAPSHFDVHFDALPDGATAPVSKPAEPARLRLGRAEASAPPLFTALHPRPARGRGKALAIAAIIIIIVLAGGCGWLYYTGRTYWFNPAYVKMRISNFVAGSPASQVQTDAYSASARSAPPAGGQGSSASTASGGALLQTQGSGTNSAGDETATAPASPKHSEAHVPASASAAPAKPGSSLAGNAGDLASAAAPTVHSFQTAHAAHHAQPVAPAASAADAAQSLQAQVQAAVVRGDYYFDHGDYDAAIRAYQDGLTAAPDNQHLVSEIARARKAQAAEAKYLH